MARVLQSLELFAPSPSEAPRIERRAVPRRAQLWLAVALPSLALECFAEESASLSGSTAGYRQLLLHCSTAGVPARVVVELERGQPHVVAASPAAAEAGIAAGMKLSTALALAASLQVLERAPSRERECLESLAAWAETLTSMVSVEPPDSLLLEVGGSLKLFGSLAAIKAALREQLVRRYRDFRFCAAPTATAALWLARAAAPDVVDWRQLPGSLASLPLAATRWPAEVQSLLHELGLRTVGDCARLPRDGFARRVGRAYLLDLDRAFGRIADLRAEFRAPHAWSSRVELAEESVDNAVFIEAVEHLLDELCGELKRRQAAIHGYELDLEHLHRPPTVESFDLREPTFDRERLLMLAEDRLERCRLPVPAVAVRLRSSVFRPVVHKGADLFDAKPVEESTRALLERLQGRFGASAVYGLETVAEHRPEKAWAKRGDGERRPRREAAEGRDAGMDAGGRAKQEQLPMARGRATQGMPKVEQRRERLPGAVAAWTEREARPLWLLQKPVPIEARADSLKLVSGPERIESGWWDEQDVARDYYTAENERGQKLWIFRDHRTRAWFLHGLFG